MCIANISSKLRSSVAQAESEKRAYDIEGKDRLVLVAPRAALSCRSTRSIGTTEVVRKSRLEAISGPRSSSARL
jgi:hypothetical protein